jgi:hypothetical protein
VNFARQSRYATKIHKHTLFRIILRPLLRVLSPLEPQTLLTCCAFPSMASIKLEKTANFKVVIQFIQRSQMLIVFSGSSV